MGIKCKKRMRLLVLADIPEGGMSIIDWRPFGKSTLNDIVEKYNENCIETYRIEKNWPLETIENNVEIIKPVTDLNLSKVLDLREDHFVNIQCIMIDLDAIAEREDVLKHIKECIPHGHPPLLLQVSRTPGKTSYVDYFQPVESTTPEIMADQATFEEWLNEELCKRYRIAVTAQPPEWMMGDPKLLAEYFKSLPEIAATVRDAAITRDLSEKETIALAQRASMQEIALTRITEQVRTQTNLNVVLDAIREPVVNMPIELGFQSQSSVLRDVDLVWFHATQPMYKMTTEQRNSMLGFGIKEEVEPFVVATANRPTVRDDIERLKLEGVVKTDSFSVKLPVGLMGMRWNL